MFKNLPSQTRRGILFLISGMLVFSCLNALVKGGTAQYHPCQLVFFRCFLASFPAGIFLLLRRGWSPPSSFAWRIYGIRALLLVIGFSFLFSGIPSLPLANSMALYFSSTIFLVLFSYPILKEKVSFTQWIAVVIGLVGVLVVAKPSSDVFHWGTLFIVIGASMEAVSNLYGRLISSSQNGYMLTFLGSLMPALLSACFLPFVWIQPDFEGWIVLICLGLGGGIGQLFVTFAYTYAPAGTLAPMIYSAMLWSVGLDILLYGTWPTLQLIVGCTIIIGSGLLIFVSESRQKLEV